ncbi:MAG TPA: FtsX-like permease family protein [Thermoanaerobaculia bacterium]|nr:FtsX-like permease family protein [Thermoanaerobaculia bacterium]
MKYLHLLFSNLRRRKARTIFTLLSIAVAFVLFSYLAAIRTAFAMGIEVAGSDRLLTINKVSIIMPLPIADMSKIAATPGVKEVTHASWFGAVYQDSSKGFQGVSQFPVVPEEYLRMYPEFKLPPEQLQAWLADRQGAIVGEKTAERFGWKIGDRIPLQAAWTQKNGSRTWEFNLRGIYTGDAKGVDTTQFLFRYDFFDEARARGQGNVGWYIMRVADPAQADKVANRVDALFENSAAETETSTEKAFMQSFAKQTGDIGAMITAILSAVFFTILLVAGNTMAQSVRERISELAVLKTLGFPNGLVMALVLGESCLIAILGGGLGLLLGSWLVSLGDPTGGALPIFYFPARQVALGAALVLLLGLLTGALPAVQALRLRIVDALRRV